MLEQSLVEKAFDELNGKPARVLAFRVFYRRYCLQKYGKDGRWPHPATFRNQCEPLNGEVIQINGKDENGSGNTMTVALLLVRTEE